MHLIRASSAVGAEIQGVDLANLSDDEFTRIRGAFNAHGVLFFRSQNLSPEQHLAFAKRWGDINVNRFFTALEGYPQIAKVLKEPEQTHNIGGGWHTDHSYDERPAMCSILYAIDTPESGGDTLFAGMGAAYDALSEPFKAMLAPLKAAHSSRHVFGADALYHRAMQGRIGNPEAATQDSVHPVVIGHPETGRPLLYVNPGFTIRIEGWSPKESGMLLEFLYNHIKNPRFHTRFHWQPGSLAIWDNRATWHYALNDYQGQRRYLNRITVEGCALSPAGAA